jgi:hypothetical protein
LLQQKDKIIKKKLVATISGLMLLGMLFCAEPLLATKVDYTVAHDDDDAYEFGDTGSVNLGNDGIRIYSYTTTNNSSYRYGGFRWTGVAVPQGATITAAWISVYPVEGSSYDEANFNIYFQDSDNPGTFTSTAYDISNTTNRPRTSASTNWVDLDLVDDAYNDSPSIVSVIQEIVNRSGWSSGNAMVAILVPNTDSSQQLRASSHDASTAYPAKLHIEYSTAGNDPPDYPNIDNYNNGSCTTDTTPTLQFDLNDIDDPEEVKYQIQIDDESSFSSPYIADYTEGSTSTDPRPDVTYTPSALSQDEYYWRVKAVDDEAAESAWSTANGGAVAFIVDTADPTTPGSLTFNSKSPFSVTLNLGSQTTEANFSTYKIFYKQGSSGVAETDTEHTDSNLGFIDYNSASTTTISNLAPNTQYVFNIWTYDLCGKKASATEISVTTDAACFTVRERSQNSASSVTSLDVAMPTGVVEGDLMIASALHDEVDATLAASGWTNIRPEGADTLCDACRTRTWYKVAGAGESGPYTFTFTGGTADAMFVHIIAFQAPGGGTWNLENDSYNVDNSDSNSDITTNSINGVVDGLIYAAFGNDAQNTVTTVPSAMGEDHVTSESGMALATYYGCTSSTDPITKTIDWSATSGELTAIAAVFSYTGGATTTTIGDGTDPSNSTVAPGSVDQYLDQFSFVASSGTDSVTALTVTTANTSAIASVQIWNEAMSTQYFSTDSTPNGNLWEFSGGTAIPVTTSAASLRVVFTAKDHATLAAGTYAVTGTVTAYTCTNSQAGTDTDSATITVDNSPPSNATWGTITPGDQQIQLNWTNPGSDFNRVVILRRAGAAVGDAPTDGTEYNVNDTIGSSTVRYVGNLETFTDTGLTNGTDYYYKIFAYDNYINYVAGAGTGPHTPAPPILNQVHVRWRNDDGLETASSGSITIGTVRSATVSGTDTLDITNVEISGENRYLLVGICYGPESGQTTASVVLDPGGVDETSLTHLDSASAIIENDGQCELWGLLAPPTGNSFTVRATITAAVGSAYDFTGGAWPLSGVNQTDTRRTVVPQAATGSPSVTVSSASGEIVFGTAFMENASAMQIQSPGVEDWELSVNDAGGGAHSDGASSVTLDWTSNPSSDKYAAIAVAIKPAPPGSAATFDIDEDTALTGLAKNTSKRVRFLVSNSGTVSASNTSYRLEFAETDTCSSGSYSAVPTSAGVGDKWEIVDSTHYTDPTSTDDITDGIDDALPNPGGMTFVAGELRDDNSNSTGGITLDADEFTEIEFTIQATNDALDSTNYCFKLTNSGTDLDSYAFYAEVTLAGGGGGDTDPPTPDPMTFASAPANDSATQISMTATAGTDSTTPVEYLFTNDNSNCGANVGTGGTSSSWQSSASYSDASLQANKCYGYTVTARDSVSPTPNTGTASSISSTYTSANTPGTPTLSGATQTTLNLTNAENSNPSSNPTTYFAVQVVTTTPNDATWLNKWVDASGNPSASEAWLTDTQLDALVLQGLTSSTTYGVKVKARNQDGDETPLSAEGQGTTLGSSVTTNYRSIGTNTGTLYNTGNASITIGTTTVTFGGGASLPVPTAVGAVGVGDKLVIGSETFYILSRDDNTHVTVQTAATSTHTNEAYAITRAYNDIQTWEDGRQGDLVAGNRIEVGVAYKDGVFAPTTTVTINGSENTDATHYMSLTVAPGQRHTGIAGTGVIVDGGSFATDHLFYVRDKYFRMAWLEIRNFFRSTTPGQPIIVNETSAGNNLLSHLIIHNYTSNDGTAVRGAINVYEDAIIRNCIIYSGDKGIRTYSNANLTLTLENVTIYGMTGTGVDHDKGKLIVKNTISVGSGNNRDFDLDNDDPVDASSGYNLYGTVTSNIHPGTSSGLISISFDSPSRTITRSTGSFVTDGFVIGNIINTDSGTNTGPFTITDVTALVITVTEAVTTQPASSRNVYLDVSSVNRQSPPASLEDLFVSIIASSEDLHLESSGHDALNNGADLSSSFTNDIDDETRPSGAGTWDIGADEYGAASNSAPSAPTTPYCNDTSAQTGQTNPSGITDPTPAFSAIYNDPDSGDIANKYRVEVNTQSNFGGTIMWDSGAGGTSMTNTTEGNRCPDIIYAGSALANSTQYFWRITFWDDDNTEGTVSAIQNFTTSALQAETAASWYNTDWQYRKHLRIDSSRVAGDLNNFPVLISTIDADWIEDSQGTPGHVAQTDGGDILFTDSDGTKLDHEIERYDYTTGELVAWVEVPALSGSADTSLYIYYGNTSLDEAANQWNAAGVWDSNFREVFHLHEASGTLYDSTASGYTGTAAGNATQGAAGKISKAVDFDGSAGSRVTLADGIMAFDQTFTFSAWVRADTIQNEWEGIVTKGRESDIDWQGLWINGSNRLTFGWDSAGAGNVDGSTLSPGQWYYVAATYDGTNRRLYLNDALDGGPSAGSHSTDIEENTLIGEDLRGSVLDGVVDEVRISNIARPAAWIQTEYYNQRAPAAFYTVGIEETDGTDADPFDNGWQYSKKITILASEVAAVLTNFPVLINTTHPDWADTSNSGYVAQSDGGDILFLAGNRITKLDHEIESYDETTGELVAWVEVLSLSDSQDTDIYIFYGNANAVDQWNTTGAGVWEPNYAGVWHLHETSGDHADSTWNDNTGTLYGGVNQNGSGQFDGADVFDATDDYLEPTTNGFNTQAGTIDFWIKPNWNGNDNQDHRIYINEPALYDWDTNAIYVQKKGDNDLEFIVADDSASDYRILQTDASGWVAGEWRHIVVSWDSALTLKMYLDGVDITPSPSDVGTPGLPTALGATFTMGGYPGSGGEMDGILDEVRVSRVARSAAWTEAEHNNQKTDSTFYIIDDDWVGPCWDANYAYRKKMTITAGSADIPSGYSVSVTFDHAALVSAGKSLASGDDLRVAHWDGSNWTELDRTLEPLSAWNDASTQIWFALVDPITASSADSTYYLHYGYSSASNPPDDWANVFMVGDDFNDGTER